MFPLENPIQHYPWGSTKALCEFLRARPDGRPYAELWMGTHPLAPSRVQLPNGDSGPLSSVLETDGLPYLFKVLSAARPLSLQVHPARAMAREGYADEEARGVALSAPDRVFKDPNHKPELVLALTRFETLVGFRPTVELLEILPRLGASLTTSLADRLKSDPGFAGIVRLLSVLLSSDDPVTPGQVREVVAACSEQVRRGTDPGRAYSTAVELARWYPGDPGVVAGLLLNRVSLQPGEAAFMGHGIIHAHLSGTCLEIMACSDNVLRAGLTEKHIERDTLLRCLRQGMSDVYVLEPTVLNGTRMFTPPVEEFALAQLRRCVAGEPASVLPGSGARIVLCTGGEVELASRGGTASLRRGDSVYVPPSGGEIAMRGVGEVAQAYAP